MENEGLKEELLRAEHRLLKVTRDKSFLLDRLLNYEKPDPGTSSDAGEETESSDDDERRHPPPQKRKKGNSEGGGKKGNSGTSSSQPPRKEPKKKSSSAKASKSKSSSSSHLVSGIQLGSMDVRIPSSSSSMLDGDRGVLPPQPHL
ncbi:unnamed protein product [Darwinula stevensoni]|uniref:INO80 complex subunit E N-terminal domain-containing protein n=1 Tax=Darwinula stevensoni TaxID=69355 RepID=A0A7R9A544_9CRUS|nr:unnamed protein product [Darwinula stevensoni]CAG0885655.1 unnamed protein product [Darwinula stevensoni]